MGEGRGEEEEGEQESEREKWRGCLPLDNVVIIILYYHYKCGHYNSAK